MVSLVKTHKIENITVIVICDECLFKKEFRENGLSLNIDEPYFGGEIINLEHIDWHQIDERTIIHAVGKETTQFFIKNGFIDSEELNYIADVPYFMVLIEKESENKSNS